MRARLLRVIAFLSALNLALLATWQPAPVLSVQIALPQDSIAGVASTSVVPITKYPVVVSGVRLLYQGSTGSDLVDQIEIGLYVEDATHAGNYNINILIYTAGDVTYAAAGSLDDVYIDTVGVTVIGTLPQPVSQEEVTLVLVEVEKA